MFILICHCMFILVFWLFFRLTSSDELEFTTKSKHLKLHTFDLLVNVQPVRTRQAEQLEK